jgi:putative hemolysin
VHIVDELIAERAPGWVGSPGWPVVRPLLNALLNRRRAVMMADTIAPLSGREALAHVSALLDLEVGTRGLEHVPASGACILVANHPTGIADGIAVLDAVQPRRPDLMFYANADAHRVCPRFGDVLIPVEWVEAKRTREKTRETLRQTADAVARGAPLVIFPAGRLARVVGGVLRDPDWMPTAVTLARKNGLPVVPVRVSGPFAFWFHAFDRVSPQLRDITLFHELLNKRGKRYELAFGPPIPPDRLAGDAAAVTSAVKNHVEQVMAERPDAPFAPGLRSP